MEAICLSDFFVGTTVYFAPFCHGCSKENVYFYLLLECLCAKGGVFQQRRINFMHGLSSVPLSPYSCGISLYVFFFPPSISSTTPNPVLMQRNLTSLQCGVVTKSHRSPSFIRPFLSLIQSTVGVAIGI